MHRRCPEGAGAVARGAAAALEALAARSGDAVQAAMDQLPSELQKAVGSKVSAASAMPPAESCHTDGSAAGGEDRSHRDTANLAAEMTPSAPDTAALSLPTGASLAFVPARLLAELQDSNNWRVRALAVEELQGLVKELGDAAEYAGASWRAPKWMG